MELEIQDKLDKIYDTENIEIQVDFIDFNKYEVSVNFILKENKVEFKYLHIYNNTFTFDFNIFQIVEQLDKRIIKYFKSKEYKIEND